MWPSLVDLASDIEVPADRVKKWPQRGSIPPEYWPSMIAAAAKRGRELTAEHLMNAHAEAQ